MCPWNGTSQCALRMGLSNVPVNGTIQCDLGMGLANVLYECDYPMYPGNGTIKCFLERN